MGTTQSTTLHTDTEAIRTSAVFADDGAGVSRWLLWSRIADGGSATVGKTTDAAIMNPATNGTLISFTRGLLTQVSSVLTNVAAILAAFKAEDAAHVSADLGVMGLAVRKDTAAASSGTTGDYEPLQTDSNGRLRTLARRDPTDVLSVAHMAAAGSSQIVKASPGTLHSIVGYVAAGADGFIQVHDATTVPADTAVPELSVFVAAASAAQPVNIPLPGHVCGAGITLVWSTTGATKTLGAAAMMVAGYYE